MEKVEVWYDRFMEHEPVLMQQDVYLHKLAKKKAFNQRNKSIRRSQKSQETSLKVLYLITSLEYGYKMTNQEIGDALGMSRSSVAGHVKRLIDYGMLTSKVKHIPGFTGHPLAFRELRVPNAVSES